MVTGTIAFACDAVLFDLDGVLVDSTACIEATWRHWAEGHGLDAAAVLRIAHGRHAAGTQSIALATTHPPEALRHAHAVTTGLDALTVRVTQSERGPRLTLDVQASLSR